MAAIFSAWEFVIYLFLEFIIWSVEVKQNHDRSLPLNHALVDIDLFLSSKICVH
jgi:hypothetical protein